MAVELMTGDGCAVGSGFGQMEVEDDRIILRGDITMLIEAHIEAFAQQDEPIDEEIALVIPIRELCEALRQP